MPELAELKLTADYINKVSKGKTFVNIKKNPQHKWKEVVQEEKEFKINAKSRGKELIVYLNEYPIRMSMGMTGHFRMTETGKEVKHSHLIFESKDGMSLSFVDVRRFGKWWPGEEWSSNRGPDPTTEFGDFVKNIEKNLGKLAFSKPICEVLLNQQYFNGIGNYLRAEIIYRIPRLSPFTQARKALGYYFDEITSLCNIIPLQAYQHGGGSIKDWENPFGVESNVGHFMKCYGNPEMVKEKDSNGRMIWYRPEHQWVEIPDEKWDYYSGLPSPAFYENIKK